MGNIGCKRTDKQVVRLLQDVRAELIGMRARMEKAEAKQARREQRNTQRLHQLRASNSDLAVMASGWEVGYRYILGNGEVSKQEARHAAILRLTQLFPELEESMAHELPAIHDLMDELDHRRESLSRIGHRDKSIQTSRTPANTPTPDEILEEALGKRCPLKLEDMLED